MKKHLRILSLGAGVQSSTLALMIERGEIPNVDAAIFADVKGEPKSVETRLAYLETQITKFPIYKVGVINFRVFKHYSNYKNPIVKIGFRNFVYQHKIKFYKNILLWSILLQKLDLFPKLLVL